MRPGDDSMNRITELEMMTVEQAETMKEQRAVNRRKFMIGLGLASGAVGVGLTGCSESNQTPSTVLAAGPSETDILNFALNLEFLETTFYSFATQGTDLPASLIAGSGPVTGAPPAKLTFINQQITDVLNEIFFDEMSHVAALQNVLGSSQIKRPALNLAAAGQATGGNFITIARQFVDVGASAYAGGIALLTGANLTTVAQILPVEGFHAGALRLLAIQQGLPFAPADGLDVPTSDPGAQVLATQGPTSAGGFFATAGTSTATASVPAGLAFTRSASQVLQIVYNAAGQTGISKGGFFPNGLNGNITTT
jgi:Ferritin-like domain